MMLHPGRAQQSEWGTILNLHKPSALSGCCAKHHTRYSSALILTKTGAPSKGILGGERALLVKSVPKPAMSQSWLSPSMEKTIYEQREAKKQVPKELVTRMHVLPYL